MAAFLFLTKGLACFNCVFKYKAAQLIFCLSVDMLDSEYHILQFVSCSFAELQNLVRQQKNNQFCVFIAKFLL